MAGQDIEDTSNFSFETVWDYLITGVLEGRRRAFSKYSGDQALSVHPGDTKKIKGAVNVCEEALDMLIYDLYRNCPRLVTKKEKETVRICTLDMIVSLGRDKGRKTGGREQRHSLGVMKNVIEAGGDMYSIIDAGYHDVTEERFDAIADRSSKASVANNMQAAYERGIKELFDIIRKKPEFSKPSDQLEYLVERYVSSEISKEKEDIIRSASKNLPKILNRLVRESEVRLAGIFNSTGLFDETESRLTAKRWGKMQRLLTRSLTDAYDTSLMKMVFPRKGRKYAFNSAVYTHDDVISYFFDRNSENDEMTSQPANRIHLELTGENYDMYSDMDAGQLDYHLKKNLGIILDDEYEELKKMREVLDSEDSLIINEEQKRKMEAYDTFDPLLREIREEFEDKYLLEDLKRDIVTKLADALDNISNLSKRDMSLMIEENPETDRDKKYFMRLVEYKKKTRFIMDRLEAFRWNPLHAPKDVQIPKRIYALTKAFLVADAAKLFVSYHNISSDPRTGNDRTLNVLLDDLSDNAAAVAYECRDDLVSTFIREPSLELGRFRKFTTKDKAGHLRSKRKLKSESSYEPEEYELERKDAISRYIEHLTEQKERRPKQVEEWKRQIAWYLKCGNLYGLTEPTERGQLAGRVGDLLATVREKKKYDVKRIITSHEYDTVKSYSDSFFYITALAEAFHTLRGREEDEGNGYFIRGVYPKEEKLLKMQNPEMFEGHPGRDNIDTRRRISQENEEQK